MAPPTYSVTITLTGQSSMDGVTSLMFTLAMIHLTNPQPAGPCTCVTRALCKPPFYQISAESTCDSASDVCCARQVTGSLPLSCGVSSSAEMSWVGAVLRVGSVGLSKLGTATLVHPGVVITAAHIVHRLQPSEVRVKVRGREHAITKILVHPQFRTRLLHNDVALLVLDEFSDEGVTCLEEPSDVLDAEGCVFAVVRQLDTGLHVNNMTVMLRRECQSALQLRTAMGPYFHLHNTFVCALGHAPHHTAVKGDGGGPLLCPLQHGHLAQVGVASWRKSSPCVFSAVGKSRDWVDTMLSHFSARLDHFKL